MRLALTLLALAGLLSWAWTARAPRAADPVLETATRIFEDTLRETRSDALPEPLRAERRTMEDPWVARGDHYEVRTAASPRLANWAAVSLDAQLATIQEFLGTTRVPDEPFQIVIYPDLSAYRALGDARYDARSSITGGFFANASEDGFVASYELDNYNLILENLVYGAFLQYAEFLAPRRDVVPAFEQAMASFFAARASTDLATFTFQRFEKIRDGAASDQPWTPLGALLALPLDSFATSDGNGVIGGARRVQLVQLVSFLQYYFEDTRVKEDGAPGPFQDFVRRAYAGKNVDRHPLAQRITDRTEIQKLDAVLKAFRGWSGY